MVDAIFFTLTVLCAGWAVVRGLGLSQGALALGLAPSAGLAALAVVASWSVLLAAPPPLLGVLLLVIVLGGLGLAIADRQAVRLATGALLRQQPHAVGTLVAALGVPMLVMGVAFGGVQVPLSPHDGASHTEMIAAYRLGQSATYWYPPGLAAIFAAWLDLMPWVDSAQGAFELGMSLPLLAAVAVFGLGLAVWRDLRMAAAGALLLGFTYVYPYFPQLWSGWPLAMSLILVIGLWTIGLEYLRQTSGTSAESTVTSQRRGSGPGRWGVLAGLMLAGVMLVHGSEVYTLAVLLPILLIGGWRRVAWAALARDVPVAIGVALVGSAVYLPTLVGWAGAGGAYAVGFQDGQALAGAAAASVGATQDPFVVFGLGALGIDLPIRVVLLVGGAVWAVRARAGRSVIVIGVLFVAIAAIFSVLGGSPVVHQLYALVFPWSMHYRLFMVAVIAQVLLGGAGLTVGWRRVHRWARRPGLLGRQVRRLSQVLVGTWLVLAAWAMTLFVAYPAELVLGYTSDDAAAMAWLKDHVAPGEVVVNDGYADAGIWAPYKAGAAILLPRSTPLSASELSARRLIIDNLARLDKVPEAAAAACARRVRYVYRGAAVSAWDARRMPSLDELRGSAALRQVFSYGEALIFEPRLACDG